MQNRCSIYGNHCHTFLSIGSYFTHTHHQPSIAVDAASARAKSDSESDCKDAESWKNSIKNFCAIWIRYGRQIAFLQRTRASIGFTVVIRTHTTHPDTIHNTQRVLENDRQWMEQRQSERQRDRDREGEKSEHSGEWIGNKMMNKCVLYTITRWNAPKLPVSYCAFFFLAIMPFIMHVSQSARIKCIQIFSITYYCLPLTAPRWLTV